MKTITDIRSTTKKGSIVLLILLMSAFSADSYAVQTFIGDVDGFGFDDAANLLGFDGLAANRTGDPAILDQGDVLPDLDDDGIIAALGGGFGDVFDNRSGAEAADQYAKWTDVALSNEYAGSPGGPKLWVADDVSFTFQFAVPTEEAPDFGKEHYVSFVYGDYDADPMSAVVEGQEVQLLGNSDGGGLDGYIWRAYAPVAWSDILDGTVTIDIVAPREPYVVFDYALLDIKPLDAKGAIQNPAPGAILLGSIGVTLVGWLRRSRTF